MAQKESKISGKRDSLKAERKSQYEARMKAETAVKEAKAAQIAAKATASVSNVENSDEPAAQASETAE